MHESLRLYETALDLLDQEKSALEAENEDLLRELCQERETVMRTAWEKRAGCDQNLMRQKLETILARQNALARRAKVEADNLRLALQSTRKETTRLMGYGKVAGTGQAARFVSKEG